jgi:hypothetical protein
MLSFVPVFANKSVPIAIRDKDGNKTINHHGATSYLSFIRLSWNFYQIPDIRLPESTEPGLVACSQSLCNILCVRVSLFVCGNGTLNPLFYSNFACLS